LASWRLARLAQAMPDLVMLDYMMPIMDSTQTRAAIREDKEFTGIPVIMMSSLEEEIVRETCTSYDCFLRRPFRAKTVVPGRTGLRAPKTRGSARSALRRAKWQVIEFESPLGGDEEKDRRWTPTNRSGGHPLTARKSASTGLVGVQEACCGCPRRVLEWEDQERTSTVGCPRS
jgi:CheY-like chemotaxis protein